MRDRCSGSKRLEDYDAPLLEVGRPPILEERINTVLERGFQREILLIGNQGGTIYSPTPHLGLDRLALAVDQYNLEIMSFDDRWIVTLAEQEGLNSLSCHRKVDGQYYAYNAERIEELLRSCNPAIVGFSFTSKEANDFMFEAYHIWQQENSPLVIAGGPHPTVAYDSIVGAHGFFDLVFIGDAERSLVQLIDNIERRRGLSALVGVAYNNDQYGGSRRGGTNYVVRTPEVESVDVQILHPSPDDVRPAVWEGREVMRYLFNQGCNRNCGFCFQRNMQFKRGDVQAALTFISQTQEAGYDFLFFEDGEFSPRLNRRLLDEIEKYVETERNKGKEPVGFGAQMRWDDFLRRDEVDYQSIERLRAANFEYLFISVESVDPNALHEMEKGQLSGVSQEDGIRLIQKVFEALRDAGFEYGISTIRGFGDSLESFGTTLRTIADTIPRYVFIETAKVYPGTSIAERYGRRSLINDCYTWPDLVERGYPDELITETRERLWYLESTSPEDDGTLSVIPPEEVEKSYALAYEILTQCGYESMGRHNASYRRTD